MPLARRAVVLGCAAAVVLLAAVYLVLDVRFLLRSGGGASRDDGFLRPLARLTPVAGNQDGSGSVRSRAWRSPRHGGGYQDVGADHPGAWADEVTTEPAFAGNDDDASNVKSLPSCSFEATISLKRAGERLRERWLLPKPPRDGKPGREASAWHRELVDGLAAGFRSLCLARLDARSGRTAVVNYAVVLPKGAAAVVNASLSPEGNGGGGGARAGKRFPAVYVLHARDGAFAQSAGTDVRPNVADVAVDYLAAMSLGRLPQLVLVLPFSKPCSLWADYEGGWVGYVGVSAGGGGGGSGASGGTDRDGA
jgi:hypothetical protein